MQIAVVGTGYVGLVAGVCLADSGNRVVCVDTDARKIEALRQGQVPIYEPGLAEILHRTQREGHVAFTTSHAEAMRGARVCFIGVGTPEGPDGSPDLRYVDAACESVLQAADGPLVLVLKSTVPVGTAKRVRGIVDRVARVPVHVVNNPEFLKEGAAVDDFLRPDRVVIGCASDEAWEVMKEIYEPFVRSGRPILRMTNEGAELTKYAANAMLATRISFMNEIARLCDAVGVDVEDVRRGIGTDKRIGPSFLYAGCGYGGSCFPKDTQGLIHSARRHGVEMTVVTTVEAVNDRQKSLLVDKVREHFGGDLAGRTFCLWGLAFKPQTDDVREAPALVIARELAAAGARVVASDPEALETFREAHDGAIDLVSDPYEAAKGADALLLVTEWHEYRNPDWARLGEVMRGDVVFDGRNVWDPRRVEAAGFTYHGMGRRGTRAPLKAAASGVERTA